MAMAAKSRPGRVGRMLLRAVFDQPKVPEREPLMPASTAKLPEWLRLDQPAVRNRELLRA
jgi:hypothetical protein